MSRPSVGPPSADLSGVPDPREPTPPAPNARGVRALFTLRHAPPQWPIALRTVVCVVTPALVGAVSGDLPSGLLASLGGFAGLFGGGHPYVYRARLLAVVALAQALAVGLGIWAGSNPWLGVLVVTGIAVVATWCCNAFGVPAATYQIALTCATGTAMAALGADPVRTALLVLAGGLFAAVVHVSPALADRHGPERRVVASAAEAVADYVDAIGTPAAAVAQHDAATRLYASWITLVNEQPHLRHPGRGLLRLREIARQLQLMLADTMRRGQPDPAAAERARRLARRARRRGAADEDFVLSALPLGRPSRVSTLAGQLRPGSRSLLVVVRVGIAAAAAGTIGSALGLAHAYWSIAAAVLVLSQGLDQRRTVQRGLERTAGTAVGVGLTALITLLHPAGWLLVLLLAVAVYLTQLLVPRNYAAAAVFITCSALLIAGVGRTAVENQELLVARAGDTALGCVVALGVFAVLSNKSPTGWLPVALAETVDAAADAVEQLTPETVTTRAGMVARRTLQRRTITLNETFVNALNGFTRQQAMAGRLWPAVVATERIAYRVLAEGWRLQDAQPDGRPDGRDRPDGAPAEAPPSAGLRRLAASIRDGRGAGQAGEVPSFLSRDVGDLRRVLGPIDISRLPQGVISNRRRDPEREFALPDDPSRPPAT